MKEIYLAGGCFWGIDAYFKNIKGVLSTEVGYANGKGDETYYENLSKSDHAETVKINFDENIISLADILENYYYVIDPFSINKQGNDIGRQYRTGIYTNNEDDIVFASKFLKEKEELAGKKIMIELEPLKNYVKAEDYHQDYLEKNPTGYCHINLNDRWEKNDEEN